MVRHDIHVHNWTKLCSESRAHSRGHYALSCVVFVCALCFWTLPSGCCGTSRYEAPKSEKQTLDDLLEAVYHERWREFPEYATYSGFHHYDDALESFTMAAFDRRKDLVEQWLAVPKYLLSSYIHEYVHANRCESACMTNARTITFL